MRPAREFVYEHQSASFSTGNVVSFRMQVSRTTRKVGPGASQRPCASLGFDERNRLGLGHRLAPVLAVRTGQCRGQLEPDDLATNDGRRMHDIKRTPKCRPRTQAIEAALRPGCGSWTGRNDTVSRALSGRATVRDLTRSRPLILLRTGYAEPRRERPRGRAQDAFARGGRGRSRLGSVPLLTELLTGAAQDAAHRSRGVLAQVVAPTACSSNGRSGAPHIAGERSSVEAGVEGGG